MVDVNKVYKKYQKALNFLNNLMDTTVDLLNDLKLEDPEKSVKSEYISKYKYILNDLEENINKLHIKKNILLIGDENNTKGVELPALLLTYSNELIFNFPHNNQNKYQFNETLENSKVNFDAYIDIRKLVLILGDLIRNILEFKIFLIKVSDQ